MNTDNNISIKNYSDSKNKSSDMERLLIKMLGNWKWILVYIFFFLGVAYIYNYTTTPVYLIKSSMVVEEEKVNSPLVGGQTGITGDVFSGLGITNNMRNIFSQIFFLKSTPIISKTLDELDYEVSYFAVDGLISRDIYEQSPFKVIWDKYHPQLVEADFLLNIQPDGKLTLFIEDGEAQIYNYQKKEFLKSVPVSFSKKFDAGIILESDLFSFQIILSKHLDQQDIHNYKFRFHTPDHLLKEYKERLEVSLPMEKGLIIELSVKENSIKRGVDFLNKLTEIYQLDNLNKKNDNANRTIQFISSQLQIISDSLNVSEIRLEDFQSQNQVLDFSLQSEHLLDQMNELDDKKVGMETKNKYYHYLKDYIERNQNLETIIAPSAMGINDPLLNNLILQLNELLLQKQSLTSIRQESDHPAILKLNAQINSAKMALLESIDNTIAQSDLALEELNSQIRRYEVLIRRLPGTERNYINIERTYKLNNETYTFLLQKLSEAQIAKASNVPDSMVLEEAQLDEKIKPQTIRIFSIALLLGIIFPAAILFLKDLFSKKIESQQEIEAITNYPIIGHVFRNKKKNGSRTLLLDKPNIQAGETYRGIRNKLNLICKGKKNPVIGITSTFPNEGKTYNAINIASSFALIHKKTILLDLDLRNSKIAEEFKLKSDSGIVNYIIGEAELSEITFKTKHPYLNIIPAGPIPPNPAEMLIDEKVTRLLANLKEVYDVVVIDTPPVGLVADLFQLHEYVDVNLFIVRHRYTHKLGLKTALEEVEKNQLKGVGIIINGIQEGKNANSYSYSYGYAYGYGYGNGKKNKNGRKSLIIDSEQVY